MIVRELLTRVGFVTDRNSQRTAENAIGSLRRAATTLAGIFVTGALAQGLNKLVQMGSDADETLNVINESFKDNAQSVLDWSAQQADALGRSKYQLQEYAATLGAVITPLTGNADASAEFSTNLAQLAVDLGSFFNAAETDVLTALRAGLVGSSEPMMRFGVVMTEANLEAFRLERGLAKSVKQMNAAEKTALRYEFIMAKTVAAQGDAVRTADGFANASKRLGALLLDIGTDIGQFLLPAAGDLLSTLIAITKTLRQNLQPALESMARVGRGLATAFEFIAEKIDEMSLGFKVLAVTAAVAWLIAFAPAVVAIALIGAISAAIYVLIDDFQSMGEGGKSVSGALISEFTRLRDETGSIFGAIGEMVGVAADYWATLIEENISPGLFDPIRQGLKDIVWFWDDWNSKLEAFADFMSGGAVTMLEQKIQSIREKLEPMVELLGKFFTSGEFVRSTSETIRGALPKEVVSAVDYVAQDAINTGQQIAQTINVVVNAEGGADAGQIADQTSRETARATANANRQTARQLLVGGGA